MKTVLIVLGVIVSFAALEVGILYLWHKFYTGGNNE